MPAGGSWPPENEFNGDGMGEAYGGGDRHMLGEAREGWGEGHSRGEGRYCLRQYLERGQWEPRHPRSRPPGRPGATDS